MFSYLETFAILPLFLWLSWSFSGPFVSNNRTSRHLYLLSTSLFLMASILGNITLGFTLTENKNELIIIFLFTQIWVTFTYLLYRKVKHARLYDDQLIRLNRLLLIGIGMILSIGLISAMFKNIYLLWGTFIILQVLYLLNHYQYKWFDELKEGAHNEQYFDIINSAPDRHNKTLLLCKASNFSNDKTLIPFILDSWNDSELVMLWIDITEGPLYRICDSYKIEYDDDKIKDSVKSILIKRHPEISYALHMSVPSCELIKYIDGLKNLDQKQQIYDVILN